VGETGRKFGVRLQNAFEAKATRTFTTRTQQIRPHQPCSSRELYDQLVQGNGDRQGAGTPQQDHQRGYTYPQGSLEGQNATNRDEDSYQLSHAYDRFLGMASSRFPVVSKLKN